MAPARELTDGPQDRAGQVFDKTLPLEQAAEAYAAMDKREAIKVLLSQDALRITGIGSPRAPIPTGAARAAYLLRGNDLAP